MKRTKIFKTIFFGIMALLSVACDETVEMLQPYAFEISFAHSSKLDRALVEGYFKDKNAPYGGYLSFSGPSRFDCDAKASERFYEITATFSRAELAQLGLSDSCRFTYSASRNVYMGSSDGDVYYVAQWAYPQAD